MSKITIINKFHTGTVHKGSYKNLREAVKWCIKCGIRLEGADLSNVDLSNIDFKHLKLSGANLGWSSLTESILSKSDLMYVDLYKANLRGANLRGANLNWANLNWADLEGADLEGADLREVILIKANLGDADLSGAFLYKADFYAADLSSANLTGANIMRCNGNGKEIETIQTDVYPIVICHPTQEMAIGDVQHSIKDWMSFTDGKIENLRFTINVSTGEVEQEKVLEFWKEWKPKIEKILGITNKVKLNNYVLRIRYNDSLGKEFLPENSSKYSLGFETKDALLLHYYHEPCFIEKYHEYCQEICNKTQRHLLSVVCNTKDKYSIQFNQDVMNLRAFKPQ